MKYFKWYPYMAKIESLVYNLILYSDYFCIVTYSWTQSYVLLGCLFFNNFKNVKWITIIDSYVFIALDKTFFIFWDKVSLVWSLPSGLDWRPSSPRDLPLFDYPVPTLQVHAIMFGCFSWTQRIPPESPCLCGKHCTSRDVSPAPTARVFIVFIL